MQITHLFSRSYRGSLAAVPLGDQWESRLFISAKVPPFFSFRISCKYTCERMKLSEKRQLPNFQYFQTRHKILCRQSGRAKEYFLQVYGCCMLHGSRVNVAASCSLLTTHSLREPHWQGWVLPQCKESMCFWNVQYVDTWVVGNNIFWFEDKVYGDRCCSECVFFCKQFCWRSLDARLELLVFRTF